MNHFSQLREIAAKKRDSAIESAKADYNATIRMIAELETKLKSDRHRPGKPPVLTLIDELLHAIPGDRTFTLDDACGCLAAASPGRKFAKASVNTNLNRLVQSGAIKRVRFAGHGKPALFALPDVDIPKAKSMLDWAKEVEGWATMKPVELMVKMVENGYEMDIVPSRAVQSLEREISKSL